MAVAEEAQRLLGQEQVPRGSACAQCEGQGLFIIKGGRRKLLQAALVVECAAVLALLTAGLWLPAGRQRVGGGGGGSLDCGSFEFNAAVNNVRDWKLPPKCTPLVEEYVEGGQYAADIRFAAAAAEGHYRALPVRGNASSHIFVLDIDETALSNMPYYRKHRYGAETYDPQSWDAWVEQRAAPALAPTRHLYSSLRAAGWGAVFITGRPERQRAATIGNLAWAGYHGWHELVMRQPLEVNMSALEYKTRARLRLIDAGFSILGGIGDQWSDIHGDGHGNRTFKLPNPMYFIA